VGLINRVVSSEQSHLGGPRRSLRPGERPHSALRRDQRMLHAWRSGGVAAADAVTHAKDQS